MVPWVGLHFVIVAFPDHNHLHFYCEDAHMITIHLPIDYFKFFIVLFISSIIWYLLDVSH